MIQDIEAILKKYGSIDDYTLIKQHLFVTFTKRLTAEDAIKNIFASLVIKGKKLNVVWCRKVDEKVELGTRAHLRVHDYSLIPAFDYDLKSNNAPKPPIKPPGELKNKDQNSHLLNMLSDTKKQVYSSMQANHDGGKKLG